jgi:HEAT repeat protein
MIVIGSVLIIALIIITILIINSKGKKDDYDSFQTLIKDIESKSVLTVSKEGLDSLLDGMINPDITANQKIGGYTALSRAQAKDGAFSPTLEIAKFATTPGQNLKDEALKNIFKAIRMNPNRDPEAHKLLLEYALANPDKAHSAEAIIGMTEFADESYIDNIINIYDKATQLTTRNACAKILTEIIKRSKDKASISTKLIAKYTGAWEEDKKLAYLRLLGTTGSSEALKILYEALNNTDIAIRMSAFKALSSSPTIEPLDAMLKVYAAEKNEIHLSKYRGDIFDLLEANENLTNEQKIQAWMKILKASPTEKCSQHAITVISGLEPEFAKSLLKMIITSPDTNAAIKTYATEKLDNIN